MTLEYRNRSISQLVS